MENEKWVGVSEPSPHSPSLHPAVQDAQECIELEEQYRQAAEYDWLWRLRKAVLLSPSIDLCEALLRGEHVPARLLDQAELHRRKRTA